MLCRFSFVSPASGSHSQAFLDITADSNKLGPGCMMIYAGFPCFFAWGLKTILFQLSGFYCIRECRILDHVTYDRNSKASIAINVINVVMIIARLF